MIKIFLNIALIPALLIFFHYLPLPEIPTDVLNFISNSMKTVWTLNNYLPIDTLFTYASYVLTIEVVIWVIKFIDRFRASATDSKPLFTFGRFKN